ncbi:MAG: response regulator [Kiritimatiellae bacterium]|nr:response regulator [Kiritimatiellia bacterium]
MTSSLEQDNSQPTILVADDMAISRKLLKTHLGSRYNVIEAKNGLEVVEFLKNSPANISCILLDMLMPVMDGTKVLEFMREHGLLDIIPVIVITAMSNSAGKISCYEAGASEIIEKPYDPKILVNRIDSYVRLFSRLRESREAAEPQSGRESSFFLTAVLDSLPQAVFVFDNSTLEIGYCNVAFEMLPGMMRSPAGRKLNEVFDTPTCTAVMGAVADLLSTRTQTPVFAEIGGRHFTLVFNAILDESGSVADIIGTAIALSLGGNF